MATMNIQKLRKSFGNTEILRGIDLDVSDGEAVRAAVDLLQSAKRPVLYAGQGIHYARAWPQLKALAERLAEWDRLRRKR